MSQIDINIGNNGWYNLASKDLTKYKKELRDKTKRFAQLLADKGIETAYKYAHLTDGKFNGSHQMGDYVIFKKKINYMNAERVEVAMLGIGTPFTSTWYDKEMTNTMSIYPLSMLEWGSGAFYNPEGEEYGNSRIAMSGHEDDEDWWLVKGFDKDNEGNDVPHFTHASAINPTRPMYNAWLTMKQEINECFQEAFGGK